MKTGTVNATAKCSQTQCRVKNRRTHRAYDEVLQVLLLAQSSRDCAATAPSRPACAGCRDCADGEEPHRQRRPGTADSAARRHRSATPETGLVRVFQQALEQ